MQMIIFIIVVGMAIWYLFAGSLILIGALAFQSSHDPIFIISILFGLFLITRIG